MARTPVTVTTPIASYPTLPLAPNSADASLTVADPTNKNSIDFGRAARLLILAINTHASTAYTVTVNSAADDFGRTGDITTYSLDAGEVLPLILPRNGWRQPDDGTLHIEASNAAVKFMAIQL